MAVPHTLTSSKVLTPIDIVAIAKGMASPYFWPNRGNYGDLLIAEGIRGFLTENSILYEEFCPDSPPSHPYNLIYGGGGGFVPQWIHLLETHLITDPLVQKCLIMPCSIRGVPEFVASLDSRHTVLLRDRESYDYCTALNNKARFFMAEDMALQLDMKAVCTCSDTQEADAIGQNDQTIAACALKKGLAYKVAAMVRLATVSSTINGKKQKIAFILRRDSEASAQHLGTHIYTDVSLLYNSYCYKNRHNKKLLQVLAQGLSKADIIVSDRLHICIMAHLIGKEVFMLDNNYGKLRGVYEQSLSRFDNVHYAGCHDLPQELLSAWQKWWSPPRRAAFAAIALARKLKAALHRR